MFCVPSGMFVRTILDMVVPLDARTLVACCMCMIRSFDGDAKSPLIPSPIFFLVAHVSLHFFGCRKPISCRSSRSC